jgi:hypothetical protein
MNLSLHHPDRTTELFCRLDGFIDTETGDASRYGDAIALEDFLSLVLVDFHGCLSICAPAEPCFRQTRAQQQARE